MRAGRLRISIELLDQLFGQHSFVVLGAMDPDMKDENGHTISLMVTDASLPDLVDGDVPDLRATVTMVAKSTKVEPA